MNWIDVKEALPFDGQHVLCFQTYPEETEFNLMAKPLKLCFYHVAEYNTDFGGSFTNIQWKTLDHVSHWMELPDKPKY